MKSPKKRAFIADDPFDGDDSHCMIGYGYAGIAPPRPEAGEKPAKDSSRTAKRHGNGSVSKKVPAPSKAAPAKTKACDPFDVDESKIMIGYRYLGLLRSPPRRTTAKRKKKSAKRATRAAAR